MENLLTLKEVADLLRLSSQTVYKMLKEGSITGVKVGNQWRFQSDKIQNWIQNQCTIQQEHDLEEKTSQSH